MNLHIMEILNGEEMDNARISEDSSEKSNSFDSAKSSILIINPGVMPELREAAKGIYANGQLFIYATSFTFGFDSIWEHLLKGIPEGRFRELLSRRLLPVPDYYLERSAVSLDILIFLVRKRLPKIRKALVILRNRAVQKKAVKLISNNVTTILSHRTSSYLVFKNPLSINTFKFLNYPIAHHAWCDKYCEIESLENPFWKSMLQGNSFTKEEIRRMDSEIELADKILVPSTFVKNTFLSEGVPFGKIELLPLGYSSDYKLGALKDLSKLQYPARMKHEPIKVVFVGQLVQRKGLSYLLEGFSKASLPIGSSLTLVGLDTSGLAEARIKNLPNVFAVGHLPRSQIHTILLNSDLFILPSLFEGFPLSAIDAMSTGIPVAVSENTFANDLIEHQKNGFILKSRDSREISDLLEFTVANPDKLREIGINGMTVAKKYDWKSYHSNLSQLLFPS